MKLPPVFKKVRHTLRAKPDTVLWFDDPITEVGTMAEILDRYAENDYVSGWSCFWVEQGGFAWLVRLAEPSGGLADIAPGINITVGFGKSAQVIKYKRFSAGFGKKQGRVFTINAGELFSDEEKLRNVLDPYHDPVVEFCRTVVFDVLGTLLWIQDMRAKTQKHVPVDSGNRLQALGREGDTFRYAPIDNLFRSTVRRGEGGSGIRKRDHAVLGHWRTYKNGNRVWVKAHRRGDKSLGTVTRVLGE